MLNRKNNYSKHIYGYNTRLIAFILVFAIILSSVFTGGYSVSAETPDSTSPSKTTETSAPEEPYIIGEDIERRTENEKHFLMSDGRRVAAMYDTAVHYLDESGEYQEIDNSFESTENDEYQTKKGKNKVKLAKKASSKKLVTLHTDDYKISWGFENAAKVKAQVVEGNTEANEEFAAKNVNGKMNYIDAFKNVDLEYIVKPDGIKENIILKSADAQNEFVINYDVGKLIAVQKDARTIELMDSEIVKYTISAPVMIDANNKMSVDLSITLTEQKNGKLTVILSADSAWLSAQDRAYPVIVDPSILSTQTSSDLKCKFTYSATGAGIYDLANGFTDVTFVGYHPELKNTTSLYRFKALPTLSTGDYITDARLYLVGSDNPGLQINAHECFDTWYDTPATPLDYEPLYRDDILDYVESGSNNYCWNITNYIRHMYDVGIDDYTNCSIMLRPESFGSDYIAFANSSNSNINVRPVLALSYINHSGIESYLSYTSVSAGGGTAYINNASRNMTLELPIISTKGENLPASLVLYYNTMQAGQQGINKIGAGWRTNFDQKITDITNSLLQSHGYKYTYTDPDGTVIYMKTVEGKTNEYKDELGKGLTLKYENNVFTLTDKENNVCYFNSSGYLTKQKVGTSPSEILLTYNSSNKLSSVTDGASDKITFERNSNGFITAIVDNYGRKINFSYTNSNLTAMTYFDGTKVSFGYSSEGLLTSAVDFVGMKTTFDYDISYYSETNGKVAAVFEKSKVTSNSEEENGDYFRFFYTDLGCTGILDNNVNLTVYVFDEFGRSINTFSDNGSGSAQYTEKDKNASYKNNKISKTTSTGSSIENLALNTSYESPFWWNTYVSSTGSASAEVVSEEKRLGQSSLKLTANNRGCTTFYQKFTPKKSGYYTYSVYYKTDGLSASEEDGAKAFITYIDHSGNKNYVFSEAKTASTNGKWKRLSVTYYCDINVIKELHIANGLFFSYGGSVYFDCAQFEYSKSANKYNMISNGAFSLYENFWDISQTGINDVVEEINNQYQAVNPPKNFENSYVIHSDLTEEKRISQTVDINLPANKVALNFSAYAISMACKENDFALELTFNYSDGTKETQTRNFNYKCYAWQYLTELFVPKEKNKTVSTVKASLKFSGKANSVEFTGAQLLVDTTGKMYTYDDKGNVITALDAGNNAVSSVYDDDNRLKSETLQDGSVFTYDYLTDNNISTKLIASQTAPHNQKADFTYNSFGQQTSATLYNSTNPNGLKITASANYSNNGKYLNSETDSLGNTIRYVYSTEIGGYDLLDRVYSNSNNNSYTEYTYDTADRVIKTTASDGAQASASVNYTYEDNALSKITHNGFDYNFEYDDFGNTTKISVGNVALITNTFSRQYITSNGRLLDSPHLLTKSTYGNGDYVEYHYDNYERVIGKAFNGVLKYTYIYNSDGNIYKVEDIANNLTYTYFYDNLGRVESISGYYDFEVSFTYDGSNRITDEHYTFNGNTESVHHNYDVGGVLTSSTFSDGSVQSYTYDSLMRTSSVTTKVSENSTNSWITSYGFLNPTAETTTTLVNSITYNAINLNFSYSYDNLGNITEIKENNILKVSYEYDYLNQLTRENNAYLNKTVTYNYDNAGNILSKTYYNYTLGSLDGLTGNMVQYTYGDSNWKDKLTAYNGRQITYDEIGNPLSYYNGFEFTWKNGRTLSKVEFLNGKTANYVYNESGIRIFKKVAGVDTFFHLNGSQISAMQSGSNLYRFSYDGAGQLYSISFNGETYYYFFNIQGDVVGLYDSNLNVVVRYTYDSWGKLLSTTGSLASTLGMKNPFRYRGYYYDTETGLYYVSSRYYDPEIGRFISPDTTDILTATPMGLTDKNLFAYCDNNPVVRVDRGGQFWESAFDVISLGASIVEVCVNPTDIWAWAGLVGDAVDLIPFVTGVGEVTRAVKTTVKVADKATDVLDTANTLYKTADAASDIRKATGSYEIVYKSGKNYIGKGNFNRAITSAKTHAEGADDILSIRWKSAPSSRDAFIDEYLMQKRFGGVLRSNPQLPTYNIIWSPGRKYYGR